MEKRIKHVIIISVDHESQILFSLHMWVRKHDCNCFQLINQYAYIFRVPHVKQMQWHMLV